MATIILSAYEAIPSTGGRYQIVFNIGRTKEPALADRKVDIKTTAQALAALATYKAEAEATGKPLAVSIRLAPGNRAPNGFNDATKQCYWPVNIEPKPEAKAEPVNLLRLTDSPWGVPDHITQLAPGIVQISTPSHGGIKVSDELLAKMPAAFHQTPYSSGGWFEEDADWAFVAVCFPDAFKPEHVAMARKTIAFTYPQRVEHIPAIAA